MFHSMDGRTALIMVLLRGVLSKIRHWRQIAERLSLKMKIDGEMKTNGKMRKDYLAPID